MSFNKEGDFSSFIDDVKEFLDFFNILCLNFFFTVL